MVKPLPRDCQGAASIKEDEIKVGFADLRCFLLTNCGAVGRSAENAEEATLFYGPAWTRFHFSFASNWKVTWTGVFKGGRALELICQIWSLS